MRLPVQPHLWKFYQKEQKTARKKIARKKVTKTKMGGNSSTRGKKKTIMKRKKKISSAASQGSVDSQLSKKIEKKGYINGVSTKL